MSSKYSIIKREGYYVGGIMKSIPGRPSPNLSSCVGRRSFVMIIVVRVIWPFYVILSVDALDSKHGIEKI